MTLLVFDFDGVLAIPYTMPEQCYSGIPNIIKALSEQYILAVASYNPRAYMAIKSWNLEQYFISIRCGANHSWHKDNIEYNENYRIDMEKSNQILDIKNEIKHLNISGIIFFDDDQNNLNLVNIKLPSVITVFINYEHGFLLSSLPK